MDPFSITVGVTGLLSLVAQTVVVAKNYLSDAKNAKESINGLITELEMLQTSLQSLDEFLKSDTNTTAYFRENSALRSCMSSCTMKLTILSQKLEKVGESKRSRYLWPLKQEEHQKTIQELRVFGQWIQFSLSVDGCFLLSQTSHDIICILEQQLESFKVLRSLEAQAVEFQRVVKDQDRFIREERVEKERQSILDWIAKPGHDQKHNTVRSLRVAGTGSWLLSRDEYINWRDNDDNDSTLLWCHGIQGSGKTILTSMVVDDLKSKSSVVAYVYFDYRDQDQTMRNTLSCLLRHVVESLPEIPQCVAYAKHNGSPSSLPEIKKLVDAVIQESPPAYIVIDALDECADITSRRDLIEYMRRLAKIHNTRIFVTSRPHIQGIQEILQDEQQIEIQAQESDIKAYVDKELRNAYVEDIVDEMLKARIVYTIINRAQGMFLLPILHLRTVLKQPTAGDMEDALASLPSDLSGAFQETIKRINQLPDSRQKLGMSTLRWICHAKRTLTVAELSDALAVRPGQKTISQKHRPSLKVVLECCQGLVAMDPTTMTVRFAHYTIQEYLIKHTNTLFGQADVDLAAVCLTYLRFEPFSNGPLSHGHDISTLLHECPFLRYASVYWGLHVQTTEDVPQILQLALPFLLQKPTLACSWQIIRFNSKYKRLYWSPEECYSMTPMHVACHFGLEILVSYFLGQKGMAVNTSTNIGTTPIITAASRGHFSIVQKLLNHGADPYLENWYGNALHCAAESGQAKVIRELIRFGMNPNPCKRYSRSPIHSTVDNDQVKAFETLASLGADLKALDQYGQSVFHFAASNNAIKIIKMIMKKQLIEVDFRSKFGSTALHYAALRNNTDIIQILLDAGADVNARNQRGRTPLIYALLNGNEDAIHLLLDHGGEPIVTSRDSCSSIGDEPTSTSHCTCSRLDHEDICKNCRDKLDI